MTVPETLRALGDGKWHTAYDIRGDLRTLKHLEERGYVESHKAKGHETLPRHSIYWRITSNGREKLVG